MSESDLIDWMSDKHPDQTPFRNGLAVLEAKASVASSATARATRLLAYATFALVIATVALGIVTLVKT